MDMDSCADLLKYRAARILDSYQLAQEDLKLRVLSGCYWQKCQSRNNREYFKCSNDSSHKRIHVIDSSSTIECFETIALCEVGAEKKQKNVPLMESANIRKKIDEYILVCQDVKLTAGILQRALCRKYPDLSSSFSTILLNNRLQAYKKKKESEISHSAGSNPGLFDLKQWAESKTINLDLPEEPFVLLFEYDAETLGQPIPKFWCILSTPRLLKLFIAEGRTLHIDNTYKTNINGLPLFLCGHVDAFQQFHPTAVGIISGETKDDFVRIFQALKDSVNFFKPPDSPNNTTSTASPRMFSFFI